MSMSVYLAIGTLLAEPKRTYTKAKIEMSSFKLLIKRDDLSKKSDVFSFFAFKEVANFINSYAHKGDVIEVRARPKMDPYTDKDGKKRNYFHFVVAHVAFVPQKNYKQFVTHFGGTEIPEINEWDHRGWG